ncbi:hypothetical protein Tco_0711043 [Tanacetum coccineum]
MSVLQCQLISYGSMLNARYDHSLRNVERLTKRCSQQTQAIKKQNADLRQQSEFTVRANGELSMLKARLGVLESKCQTADKKLSSWDKKNQKYKAEKDVIAVEKAKVEEELVKTKSQLELRKRVDGFILDAQEKFDSSVDAFFATTFPFLDKVSQSSQSSLQDITRLEPDKVVPSCKTSSATTSLRANTHGRHSTSSSRTFWSY